MPSIQYAARAYAYKCVHVITSVSVHAVESWWLMKVICVALSCSNESFWPCLSRQGSLTDHASKTENSQNTQESSQGHGLQLSHSSTLQLPFIVSFVSFREQRQLLFKEWPPEFFVHMVPSHNTHLDHLLHSGCLSIRHTIVSVFGYSVPLAGYQVAYVMINSIQ